MASSDSEITFKSSNTHLAYDSDEDSSTSTKIDSQQSSREIMKTADQQQTTETSYPDRTPFHTSSSPAYNVKPEPYDGSLPFESYISHFNDCAELGLWENRIKVLMLATALRGPARDFYDSLTKKERRNFELLSERLAYRFGSSGIHRTIWLRRLENRKRNPSESIVSFAEDIRQLCQKAYSDFNCNSQEQLALDQLYRNVSLEMHCRCLEHECRTISQAVNVIDRYEAILRFQQTDMKDRSTESPAYSRTTIETIMQHITKSLPPDGSSHETKL